MMLCIILRQSLHSAFALVKQSVIYSDLFSGQSVSRNLSIVIHTGGNTFY